MSPRPLAYVNTSVPSFAGWIAGEPSLELQRRGIGYDVGAYHVHFYQRGEDWWTVSHGLTATEKANEGLRDWVVREFGATDIAELSHEAGEVTEWVWRPGLFLPHQIRQALDASESDQRRAEQSLHLLLERLTEVLLYVEPAGPGLRTFSLKTRELLILAATDVEDVWARYLRRAGVPLGRNGYSTNDYVRLRSPLHLSEYRLSMTPYSLVQPIRPYAGWDSARPTQSLPWYDAYNKSKHDKTGALSEATLERAIEAVAASVVLFCVRFSPLPLFAASTPVASLAQHLWRLDLVDPRPDSFYVPRLRVPPDMNEFRQCFNSERLHEPWTVAPLSAVI